MNDANLPRDLGPAERAVYMLVQQGVLTTAHLPLYRRAIQNLVRAKLITLGPDGRYLDAAGPNAKAPEFKPPPEKMPTITSRIPKSLFDAVDAYGESAGFKYPRSDAIRKLLEAGLVAVKFVPGPSAGQPLPAKSESPSGVRRRAGKK